MSSILQILPYPKFEINWTSGSKVKAKKLTFSQQKVNFLSITFEPVVWLIPNFECGKICLVDGLFAKAVFKNKVARLEDKWPGWEQNFCMIRHAYKCALYCRISTVKSNILKNEEKIARMIGSIGMPAFGKWNRHYPGKLHRIYH